MRASSFIFRARLTILLCRAPRLSSLAQLRTGRTPERSTSRTCRSATRRSCPTSSTSSLFPSLLRKKWALSGRPAAANRAFALASSLRRLADDAFRTLALSFFRFVEAWSGQIVIDGIDIASVGLKDLRVFPTSLRRSLTNTQCPQEPSSRSSLKTPQSSPAPFAVRSTSSTSTPTWRSSTPFAVCTSFARRTILGILTLLMAPTVRLFTTSMGRSRREEGTLARDNVSSCESSVVAGHTCDF
mgnify:CR=1 FL=1